MWEIHKHHVNVEKLFDFWFLNKKFVCSSKTRIFKERLCKKKKKNKSKNVRSPLSTKDVSLPSPSQASIDILILILYDTSHIQIIYQAGRATDITIFIVKFKFDKFTFYLVIIF